MCRKEIYSALMQEFAGFHKISVDVRYWLTPSVSARFQRRGTRTMQVKLSACSNAKAGAQECAAAFAYDAFTEGNQCVLLIVAAPQFYRNSTLRRSLVLFSAAIQCRDCR